MSMKGSANSFIELRGKLSIPEAIQGKSAYELAVLGGFEGTEEEWLASLVGPKGADGTDGKSAYAFAQDGGYEGTEEEFAEKMAFMPYSEGAGELWFTYTATFATDAAAKNGVLAVDKMSNHLSWLELNGELLKVHREQDGMMSAWCDADGNTWVTSTLGGVYVFAQTAGTYTYKFYAPSDKLMLEPQYIPPNVALKKDIPEGGGGADIDVVAEVGQTIVVEEVDADGKPTKWKAADYPAKEIEIIPQTTFKAYYDSNFECYMYGMSPTYSLVVGRTYTVVFDGVTYSYTAKSFYLQGMFGVYIGNSVLLGDNTGEPFALVTVPAMGDGCLCLVYDANEHTMGLTANFIEHFDSINAFPYYIVVTGSGTTEDPYACTETFADIVALHSSGREIKVKHRSAINNSGVYATAIFDLSFAYDNAGVAFQFWFVCPPLIGSNRYLLFQGTEDGSLEITDNLD